MCIDVFDSASALELSPEILTLIPGTPVFMYVHPYVCMHPLYVVYVCIYIYIYIYTHTHTHTHMHKYVYVRTTFVYMYVCM